MTVLKAVSKVAWALGAMTIVTVASAQVAQPSPPPPQPEGSIRPAPRPIAAAETTTVVSGTVKQYLINPEGDVDGILMADNNVIVFPPHLGAQVTTAMAPGDTVRVTGNALPGGTLRARKIVNARNSQTIDDQPPRSAPGLPDQPLPVAPRGGRLVKLEASGSITHVTMAPRGEPDGVLLADGTVIKLAPPVAVQFTRLLRPGTVVAAQGYGTRNQYGESLQATAFGTPGNLTQLYASAPQ